MPSISFGKIGNGFAGGWSNVQNMFSSPFSASSASSTNETDSLYETNRIWAEEQAQKQMDFQTSSNKAAMDFSAAEAEKQRAFEAEMANTAYQRAVVDLRKAGLNPILAYSQGGAAVPSVSAASGVSSSGSKASMADTGYSAAKLALDEKKYQINSALDALKLVLSFK